jgi:hypothetical protein
VAKQIFGGREEKINKNYSPEEFKRSLERGMLAVVQFKTDRLSLNDKNLNIKICNTIIVAVFRRVRKIAKSFVMSVCPSNPFSVHPHRINRLPQGGFS